MKILRLVFVPFIQASSYRSSLIDDKEKNGIKCFDKNQTAFVSIHVKKYIQLLFHRFKVSFRLMQIRLGFILKFL